MSALESARQHLSNAEYTADRYSTSKTLRTAVGAGYALLAIAEAATRIADALEQAWERRTSSETILGRDEDMEDEP